VEKNKDHAKLHANVRVLLPEEVGRARRGDYHYCGSPYDPKEEFSPREHLLGDVHVIVVDEFSKPEEVLQKIQNLKSIQKLTLNQLKEAEAKFECHINPAFLQFPPNIVVLFKTLTDSSSLENHLKTENVGYIHSSSHAHPARKWHELSHLAYEWHLLLRTVDKAWQAHHNIPPPRFHDKTTANGHPVALSFM